MSVTRKEQSYLPYQVESLLLAQEDQKKILIDHEKRLKDVVTKGDLIKVGLFLFTAFFNVGGLLWCGIRTTIRNEILENNSLMQEKVQNLEIHVSRLEASGRIERGGH